MTLVDDNLTNMERAIRDGLKGCWRLFLLQGAVMLILGVLAVIEPLVATLAINIFVGWLFLLSGLVGLVALFSSKHMPAFLWSLITAALSVAIGVLLIWRPAEGAAPLTIVLTAFFIAEGVFQIVSSISYREILASNWVWMLFSGLCDLLLAGIIIAGWPGTAEWALGIVVGVNLISSGVALIAAAFTGRQIAASIFPQSSGLRR